MATAGVTGSTVPGTVGYYVRLYGNYQPYGHAGMDIACPIGTEIYAPADGTVLYAGWCEDLPGGGDVRKWLLYYNFGGIVTVIQHDGWISVIAHQSDNDMVNVGQQVKEGQLIGLSGNTKTRNSSVAAHVHIEALVYMDYRTRVNEGIIYGRVDPTPYFGGGIAAQGTITPQEDEVTPAQMQEIKDFVFKTVSTLFEQYHDVTRSTIVEQVNKKADAISYSDRVFNQTTSNKNADRVINFIKEGK
jgi:hypothetical protein